MRYIEVIVNTPEDEIDLRCQQMADMGAGGFVIENEADFQAFLENNHQYWDYVDQELEDKFKGLSRIKCYLTDDEEGLTVHGESTGYRENWGNRQGPRPAGRHQGGLRRGGDRLRGGQRLGEQLAGIL